MKPLLTYAEKRNRRWIVGHKGLLTKIAIRPDINCSAQFVQKVANGKSKAALEGTGLRKVIEKELKKHGWPGPGTIKKE